MTIYQMAKVSGMERTALNRMVIGKRLPKQEDVDAFCKVVRANEKEKAWLRELYIMEKMGKKRYDNGKFIEKLLQELRQLKESEKPVFPPLPDIGGGYEPLKPFIEGKEELERLIYQLLEKEYRRKKKTELYSNFPAKGNMLFMATSCFEQKYEKKIPLYHFFNLNVNPEKYYDRIIEIDLSLLEPYINGPFTPDAATPISKFAEVVITNNYPRRMEVGLIGSCTNSSYQDLSRAASLARQVKEKNLKVASPLIVNPGSEQIRATAERDGMIAAFEDIGATIMANACGPCIGQWKRHTDDPERKNSIVTSFNRNFAKRADGNPNTFAYVASPEITMALTIAGDLCFDPLRDTLVNAKGEVVKLSEPVGEELPAHGFIGGKEGYIAPGKGQTEITVNPHSQRLQLLTPFPAWDGMDLLNMPLLIKVQGKCTTDHISMAGPWLRFRGHLENISDNMLMGAVNVFNGETNSVWNRSTNTYGTVSGTAKLYKSEGIPSIVVAEENYGEGSSREHAAMEPRFLNVRVILAKSFARIHETNLKKQGMLALTFTDKADYDKIRERDLISVMGLKDFASGRTLKVVLHHEDGSKESFEVQHTYNEQQIAWFRAGSALNAR